MTPALAPAPPHPFIRPILNGAELEGRTCWTCGHGWAGGSYGEDGELIPTRSFVEVKVQSDDPAVPAALLVTAKDEPGRTMVMHRDPATGQAHAMTRIDHPLLCSDCLRAAAQQLGMPPAAVELQSELAELRERAETAERERDEVRDENARLRHGAGIAQALTTLLDVEKAEQRALIDSFAAETAKTKTRKGGAR